MEKDKITNKAAAVGVGEVLQKIKELEAGHAHLKEEMLKRKVSTEQKLSDRQWSNSLSPAPAETLKIGSSLLAQSSALRRETQGADYASSSNCVGAASDGGRKLTERQYENIMQSMGQAVHAFDLTGQITFWNQMAQNLYGYTVAEALGKTAEDIIIGPKYWALANVFFQRALEGESWYGEFPVRNKRWESFTCITSLTPSHDENGKLNRIICVTTDARQYQGLRRQPSIGERWRISSAKFRTDPQQPLKTAIASKISNLASKVKSKIKTGENKVDRDSTSGDDHYSGIAPFDHKQDEVWGGASTLRVDTTDDEKPTTDSCGGNENGSAIHKVLSKKAEAWMDRNGISWPWKGNESEGDASEGKRGHFGWPWLHNDQEQESAPQMSFGASMKVENQVYESDSNTNEAIGSWSSSCGASSSGSTNINSVTKLDINIDYFDEDMSWHDLVIREQIGQGSCGTVYHALWYGSDVAVKVFPELEYPDDVILSFRKEVCLMKRLRHPNILLFMGAVTSPDHLCIVTEFLPRGSLFGLLQRNTTKFDWRRRIRMAIDIARGMNYLHHCHPPIIHLDLKSSNLLVDKNWTVKVGDFGVSRIKHETYLTTKTGKGTPQWMAPEIIRNEQADEKSDVYSYGVVLWEIATEKIPWGDLNSTQVIGAVGFMNQQLEIPKDVDPQWASLIESCCSSEPQSRPTFEEVLNKLKDLQKKFTVQSQASCCRQKGS